MMKRVKSTLLVMCFLSVGSVAKADVIELALLLDASGSLIAGGGYDLQLDAYDNIFSDTFYTNNVIAGDTLVVSAYKFSTNVEQLIGPTFINNDSDAAAFGALFTSGLFGAAGGFTNTVDAIDIATADLTSIASVVSDRMIIDISTDGQPTVRDSNGQIISREAETIAAAANAFSAGVQVNAIGVGSNISTVFLGDVASAGGGFSVSASSFADFEATLSQKLFREIQGVPAPMSFILFAIGLIGLRSARRG